ncbi:GNAT family N-acetyltransferase [Caulobacter endophyticus]|uniref:GNAT family N-acetyltransferase n=1 Tax=Caulobacter endophyticus TaxID=2172652 RepID=A0A2T9JV40_9CAUL|nr:N-acetyltransferase [Caulobacter endophyticus]PVM87411.1 GNAT family N-acetyltransferase [Caulobacter endophyticus]
MLIRPECPEDVAAIGEVTAAAFLGRPYSSQTEALIVAALRAAGALSLSLVAEVDGQIAGHIAFSPVDIEVSSGGWYGLGPVSVSPDRQGTGLGLALIREGLKQLEARGAAGCVLLGSPKYYERFGFVADEALTYGGESSPYLQRLVFKGRPPRGAVTYHTAFGA